jgi:hypothetical protein
MTNMKKKDKSAGDKKHITDGGDCWCNPTIEKYPAHGSKRGADLVIHKSQQWFDDLKSRHEQIEETKKYLESWKPEDGPMKLSAIDGKGIAGWYHPTDNAGDNED